MISDLSKKEENQVLELNIKNFLDDYDKFE